MLCCVFWLVSPKCLGGKWLRCLGGKFLHRVNASIPASTWMVRYAISSTINAVLAIIADGGRAIVVIYREGVEINYFLLYFIDSTKTLRRRRRLPGVGYARPSKPCRW